jgi:hypothetical protein
VFLRFGRSGREGGVYAGCDSGEAGVDIEGRGGFS